MHHLHLRSWGNPTSTKIAVILHGLADRALSWQALAESLADDGWRVYTPDLPGHGDSSSAEEYSVESISEALTLTLAEEGITKVDLLIGHSLGGLVAANIHKKFQAGKVILIDPVFHLPNTKALLASIRIGFHYFTTKAPLNKRLYTPASWREEALTVNGWDTYALKALSPNKRIIINCLLSDKEVLVVRARGSFVAPWRLTRRELGEKVTVLSLWGGHNLHRSNFILLRDTVRKFLDNQTSVIQTT